MKIINDAEKLTLEIYQNAKNKGFYDNNPQFPQRIALIHSEVSECFEALENNWVFGTVDYEFINAVKDNEEFKKVFLNEIKDTPMDEVADIVIRVYDYIGSKGYGAVFQEILKTTINHARILNKKELYKMLLSIHNSLSCALECDRNNMNPTQIIGYMVDVVIDCVDISTLYNFDLDFHVLAKMRYNSLRPNKHGKEY